MDSEDYIVGIKLELLMATLGTEESGRCREV